MTAILILRRNIHVLCVLESNTIGRKYIFGVSDIDLSIVVQTASPTVLDDLWRTLKALKKILPLIGEIEVFSAEEFKTYLAIGPSANCVRKRFTDVWNRSTEFEMIPFHARMDQTTPTDLLRDALLKYMRCFLPRYYHALNDPGLLHRLLLYYAGERIIHSLNDLQIYDRTHTKLDFKGTPQDWLCHVARCLESASLRLAPANDTPAKLPPLANMETPSRLTSQGIILFGGFAQPAAYLAVAPTDSILTIIATAQMAATFVNDMTQHTLVKATWPSPEPMVLTPILWRAAKDLLPFDFMHLLDSPDFLPPTWDRTLPGFQALASRIRQEAAISLHIVNHRNFNSESALLEEQRRTRSELEFYGSIMGATTTRIDALGPRTNQTNSHFQYLKQVILGLADCFLDGRNNPPRLNLTPDRQIYDK